MATDASSKETHDDYLGDGVYASYDGYHIVLDLRAQDSFTRIALDPDVFEALIRYRDRVRKLINQGGSNATAG